MNAVQHDDACDGYRYAHWTSVSRVDLQGRTSPTYDGNLQAICFIPPCKWTGTLTKDSDLAWREANGHVEQVLCDGRCQIGH
jgi:hypothetical protein